MQITDSSGASFFIRTVYLCCVDSERIDCGAVFDDEETSDLMNAGFAFVAEQQAMSYLARCEHSRFMLEVKLSKKAHERQAVQVALDYLEQRNLLDDYRFAEAWLRNRMITKAEGPSRLAAELAKRGVDRNTPRATIDEFFETVSIDEFFKRALEKLQRLGKSGDKLEQALLRLGFERRYFKNENF